MFQGPVCKVGEFNLPTIFGVFFTAQFHFGVTSGEVRAQYRDGSLGGRGSGQTTAAAGNFGARPWQRLMRFGCGLPLFSLPAMTLLGAPPLPERQHPHRKTSVYQGPMSSGAD